MHIINLCNSWMIGKLLAHNLYNCIIYHDSQLLGKHHTSKGDDNSLECRGQTSFPSPYFSRTQFPFPGTLSHHHDTRNDNSKASIAIRCIFCRRDSAPQTASTLSPPPMNGAAPRRARRKENGPILLKHLQSIPKNKAINANRKHITMTDSYCKITLHRVAHYQWIYGVNQTSVGTRS